MPVVEGRLARHGAVNRYLGQFRQFPELFSGLGHQHAHTRPNHRFFGIEEQSDSLFDVRGGRRLARTFRRAIIEAFFGDLLDAHIRRDLNYDRTGAAVAQIVERAAHDIGDLVGLNDDLTIFGDSLKCTHG